MRSSSVSWSSRSSGSSHWNAGWVVGIGAVIRFSPGRVCAFYASTLLADATGCESGLFRRLDRAHVELVFSIPAILVVMNEGIAHAGEGDSVPRNLILHEQFYLERFGSGFHIQIEQSSAEQDINLVDMWNVVERI